VTAITPGYTTKSTCGKIVGIMEQTKLPFEANCRTTAMGIMPHRDVERALKLVLSLDIPFWPQLPHVSFYEDMYVQFSQHFPGITVDIGNQAAL
jgi:hypothetical protein